MRQCPCGNFMELIEGDVNYEQKDEQGKVLTPEAAYHMSKYRMRCQACQENFCSECKAQPYHIGMTCQAKAAHAAARKCRFCDSELKGRPGKNEGTLTDVCAKKDCKKLKEMSCNKRLACNHPCRGFRDEERCLPCLECDADKDQLLPNFDTNDYCSICWVSGLRDEPCVMLQCKHIFHLGCILKQLEKKWVTPRVVFNFLNCPGCKQRIKAPHCKKLNDAVQDAERIEKQVSEKAV